MPSTSQFVDDARKLIEGRLSELDQERQRLERALSELGAKATLRRPGRPPGRKATTGRASQPPKRARKRRGGGRADQAVELIEKNPGIGASDVARQMKINPNYLYRVLGDLEKEGRVRKDARKYYPAS